MNANTHTARESRVHHPTQPPAPNPPAPTAAADAAAAGAAHIDEGPCSPEFFRAVLAAHIDTYGFAVFGVAFEFDRKDAYYPLAFPDQVSAFARTF